MHLPRSRALAAALPAALLAALSLHPAGVVHAQDAAPPSDPAPAQADPARRAAVEPPSTSTPPREPGPAEGGSILRPGPDTPLPTGPFREESERLLRQRLADGLIDRVMTLASRPDALPSDFDLAVELTLRVTELEPETVDGWRLLQQIADVAERPEIAAMAVEHIVALDPSDEWARLRRLNDHLEQANTSEERIAMLLALLVPRRVEAMGSAVASRLATDLAMLLRRTGDREGYATWLAEAVSLDPSNSVATSELAGVLTVSTDDPVARAELLVARCLADPTNLVAIEDLARLAAERGAFVGARRLLDLLVQAYGGSLSVLPDLLTRAVLASWGSGDASEALRLIDLRQRDEDDALRRRMELLRRAAEEGSMTTELVDSTLAGLSAIAKAKVRSLAVEGVVTPAQIEGLSAPLWPDLAAARAAILQITGGADSIAAARELVSVQRLFLDAQKLATMLSPEDRLSDFAECAWWILFLGDDLPAARAALDETFAAGTLPDDVTRRLNGWLALREGRSAEAAALLGPAAAEDARCRLGQAILAKERGDVATAALVLLDAARRLGGTIEGAWAYETLLATLGTRAPLWPSTPEVEVQLASVPEAFFRMLTDPGRELQFVLQLPASSSGPFDRIEATAIIENRSALPLALGPGGPVRPTVGLPLSGTSFGAEHNAGPLPMPALFDVGTRLRLGPKDRLEVRVNLGRCPVGPGISLSRIGRDLSLAGTTVTLSGQAILNPVAAGEAGLPNRLRPGVLGVKAPPVNFRINGVPFEQGWRAAAVESAKVVDRASDLDAVGTLAFRVSQLSAAEIDALPPEGRTKVEEALREQLVGLIDALPQIGPTGQAWVTTLLRPARPQLKEIEAALRASADPDVRTAVLISLVSDPADPILDETKRGDDPRLRRIAELVADRLRREAEARR